jgi:PTH1 family peptidyl-tRNA hydrolase
MWLVVGLGNPGKQYALTRHNVRAAARAAACCAPVSPSLRCVVPSQVGFMAVDALAAAEGISLASTQLRALVGKGVVAGRTVLLVKPQTFMNLSGESVVPLLKFYKVPPSRLLVIYDDLDIDVRWRGARARDLHA